MAATHYTIDQVSIQPIPKRNMTKDRTGHTYGKLFVLGHAGKLKTYSLNSCWWCQCECGKIVIVDASHLKSGTKSCGRCNYRHGMPEVSVYQNARRRCVNKNRKDYPDYGGRGIQFLFENFEKFIEEIGHRPSSKHKLDRIDNAGHYEPGNVKWSTDLEQARNTRRNRSVSQFDLSGNLIRTFQIMADAVRETGVNNIPAACRGRLKWAGGFIWRYADGKS